MKERKYLSSVHLLRGLAALAVCFYHFTNGNTTYLPVDDHIKQVGHYGNYGVQVFFIISGLVIPFSMHMGNYKLSDFKKFLLKRVIRIEPPYIISILLALVLGYISTLSPYYRGKPFHPDMLSLICHLGYLNAFFHLDWVNPVYWTLAIEFQYYILIALLFPLLSAKNHFSWLLTILLFNVVSFFIADSNFIFQYSLFFTVGFIMFKFLMHEINKLLYYCLLGVALTLIFFKFGIPGFIAALIPIVFIFTQWEDIISRFLGNISYSLYLLHVPVGMRIINLSEVFIKTDIARYLVILVATGITIWVSYIFYTYIELPCKKASQRIKYGESKPLQIAVENA
ncbi:MAG: acyltransferase [Ferruginibacter sp.]